ncbi:MAG TPA: peptide-methionine (S)-S-oxide reductase MsrA [Cyclobacteriaceae bacterium]|nr:peptide-methionine (S)-S-oxide reductase MsrA [Cyclobacteriaceae bacterium]
MSELPITTVEVPAGYQVATLASGCYWCTEAIYQDLKGVEQVQSGFSGGHIVAPSYEEVCTGTTGHAECIQFFYDPKIISFSELLEIFWSTHDPTTLNRQGEDVGPQYRSAIFYHDEEQQLIAEQLKRSIDESGAFDNPIVTEISPFSNFYPAEDYHNNYFKLHGSQPYCQMVVRPKVEKFKKIFAKKLKE